MRNTTLFMKLHVRRTRPELKGKAMLATTARATNANLKFSVPFSCFKIVYFCRGLSYLVSIPLASDMSNVFSWPSISCVRLPESGRHGTIHPLPIFYIIFLPLICTRLVLSFFFYPCIGTFLSTSHNLNSLMNSSMNPHRTREIFK